MLTRLILKNFQAHRKLALEFDPHVTTIVGPSDVGKSAIIRALRWVATNKPGGSAFTTHGEKATKVALEVDGHTIVPRRGPDGNAYDLDKQELKAFGADVPEPVAKLLNVGDINFQWQHDAPFWFSETSGEVSRRLNSIINLAIIDDVLAYVNSRLREVTQTIGACEQRAATAGARRDALKPIVETDRQFAIVENLAKRAEMQRARCDMARRLAGDAQNYHRAARIAGNRQKNAKAALDLGDCWAELAGRGAKLAQTVQEIKKLRESAKRRVPPLEGLQTAFNHWQELKKRAGVLGAIVGEIRKYRDARKILEASAAGLSKELKDKLGKVCPLCGSQIQK
jgi:chromosome segregation ATPase